MVSSDLATLVGALNDNIDNYEDLDALDGISRGVGVSGLAALPWALVGIGALSAACAIRGRAPPSEGDTMTRTPASFARARAAARPPAPSARASSDAEEHRGADEQSLESVEDGELIGLFRLTAGAVDGEDITGTWFRMLQPGGDAEDGPYMVNANSPADGGEATLLSPARRAGSARRLPVRARPGLRRRWQLRGRRHHAAGHVVQRRVQHLDQPGRSPDQDRGPTPDHHPRGREAHRRPVPVGGLVEPAGVQPGRPKPVLNTGAEAPGQEQAERALGLGRRQVPGGGAEVDVHRDGATGTFDPRRPGRSPSSGRATSRAAPSTASPACGTSRGSSSPPGGHRTTPGVTAPAAIEVQAATKVIEGVTVLEDVSFTAAAGAA